MNQDTAAPSKLYEAAVGFLVAERSNTNAWEQVAEFVANYPNTPEGLSDLKREFRIVERQVKKDFEVSKLPTAWRSAKSTALTALKNGIPLVKDGHVQPKTDVGALNKATKNGTLTATDFDRFKHHVDCAFSTFNKLTHSDQLTAIMFLTGHPLWGMPYALPTPAVAAHAAP